MHRWAAGAALVAMVGFGLFAAGCSKEGASTADKGNDKFRIAVSGFETESFDPFTTTLTVKLYQSLLYDWIVGASPDGTFDNAKGLAESWEFSPDGLKWTAKIRSGVTFSDGQPLTIDDVVFSLNRVLSKEATSAGASTLRDNIASVSAGDGNTLVVQLKRPFIFLPSLRSRLGGMDGVVIPKKYYETAGANGFASKPIGSGPYKLASLVSGQSMTFDRVSKHWLYGTPKYKQIEFVAASEEQARLGLLQRKDVNLSAISRESLEQAKKSGFTILEHPEALNVGMSLNGQWRPGNPWGDARIREAANLAINRKELIDTILHGQATEGLTCHVGAPLVGYDRSVMPAYPYSREKAKKLLEESGYAANPQQIDVYSYARAELPELPALIQAIAGYWEAAGFKVRIIQTDYGTYRDKLVGGQITSAVTAVVTPTRPVFTFSLFWGSTGSLAYVKDPKMDELIKTWNTSVSLESAKGGVREILKYAHDNFLCAPVVGVGSLYASNGVPAWPGLDGLYAGELALEGLFWVK